MAVFKEYYEVVGAAKKRAMEFARERDVALRAQWKLVQSLGAVAFRPGQGGSIKTLLYDPKADVPAGLRKLGRAEKGNIEYAPKLSIAAGKEIARTLASAPSVKDWGHFANSFGWKGRSPVSNEGGRGRIHFTSGVHVIKSRDRFFLQYPRELKDGWRPPEDLKLVRESDMLRAIEDHNAIVNKKKAA
jgi:hypothetical protein